MEGHKEGTELVGSLRTLLEGKWSALLVVLASAKTEEEVSTEVNKDEEEVKECPNIGQGTRMHSRPRHSPFTLKPEAAIIFFE